MATPIFAAAHFQNEEAALEWIEARVWPNGAVCPFCSATGERVRKLGGKTTRPGLWKCYACRKPFTVKVKTVMEASHIPAHVWLQAMHLISTSKKGISSNQLHRTLGVTLKSAWFLGHRIREAMKQLSWPDSEPMGGEGETLEMDETWVGGKSANRAYGPIPPKVAVVSLVQRGGGVRSFKVPRVTATSLAPIIARHIHSDTRFMTDESNVYGHAGAWFASHETVNHSAKEYVRGEVYTNSVEGYFSILKRGVYGVYQHVSEAHLGRYLAEFEFRYSNRIALGVDDIARTDLTVKGIVGKRLTYRTTVGRGATEITSQTKGAA
jgi:transposase-like protein